MNINKSSSNLHLIGDGKVHYIVSKTTDGEKAYIFYVLVPGPICKFFFLFVNKLTVSALHVWDHKFTPISHLEWIWELRNINEQNHITKELIKDAKKQQKTLNGLGLLNLGKNK
ncbi:MAG: hypothetical protein ACJAS1_006954 [Oleiphilaceae bacterium]|jgi:hypothetical protein